VFSALILGHFKHSLLVKDTETGLYTLDGKVIPSKRCSVLGQAVGAVAAIMGTKYGLIMKAVKYKPDVVGPPRGSKPGQPGGKSQPSEKKSSSKSCWESSVSVKLEDSAAVWTIPLMPPGASTPANPDNAYINEDVVQTALRAMATQPAAPPPPTQKKSPAPPRPPKAEDGVAAIAKLESISRQDTESHLSRLGIDGGYIIRKKDKNKVAVSCLSNGKPNHYLIKFKNGQVRPSCAVALYFLCC